MTFFGVYFCPVKFIRFLLISTFFATASFSLLHAQDTIWQAVTKGDVDAIKGFIDAGAALDEPSKTGSAPLHYAVTRNRVEVVALLLDADADPDVEDSRQRTPLDAVARGRKHNTVAFLKTQTRVEFATDENGQQVFRVVGPYGTGNRAPLLGFAIETSINLSDWESAESVDTEDGVGVLKFEPDPEVPARFFRVAVNELEE